MGFKLACGIAQALIWGTILHREPGDELLDPITELNQETAPGIVQNPGKAVIAILYDSILLVARARVSGPEPYAALLVGNNFRIVKFFEAP